MAAAIPFVREMDPRYEESVTISPLLRRITANNPSPFTFYGTNTYIVGHGTVAVIDPGPALPSHIEAIAAACAGEKVSHILVTHTHLDHSPGVRLLRQMTLAENAEVLAYGAHGSGHAAESGVQVEEGGDMEFIPDRPMRHGEKITGGDWGVEAVWTPGHTSNHLCFAPLGEEDKALITGDHIMSWSTSVIVPPDGDMAAYMRSLALVRERGDAVLWPAHGEAIREPAPFLDAFIAHRRGREAAILAAIKQGETAIPAIVKSLYADVDKRLHGAAALSVLAHIIQLNDDGKIKCDGRPRLASAYYPAG